MDMLRDGNDEQFRQIASVASRIYTSTSQLLAKLRCPPFHE